MINPKRASSDWTDEVLPDDDENRIDWERKNKHKRQENRDVLHTEEEDIVTEVARPPKKSSDKHARKKRRQLVYDEERDEVVVRRKRRRQTDRSKWQDWEEDHF